MLLKMQDCVYLFEPIETRAEVGGDLLRRVAFATGNYGHAAVKPTHLARTFPSLPRFLDARHAGRKLKATPLTTSDGCVRGVKAALRLSQATRLGFATRWRSCFQR